MGKTKISWTEHSWNPITGCSKISDGCRRCYAEKMTKRLTAMGQPKYRNGFNVKVHPDVLNEPMKLKKPSLVFVCSMSDLFHKDVPDEFIIQVFDVMKNAKQHTFQVLTKRSERMKQMNLDWQDNIWAGVTVENDKVYHRIDDLLETDAAVKYLSVEPYIGKVNIADKNVDWVIAGGESGPGSQPVNPEWVRSLRDQCIDGNIPFFFKQWGGRNTKKLGSELDGKTWKQYPR